MRGDRAKLHQAIANLLTNAGAHTPAGTTVTTTVSTGVETSVKLTVADDGPGIDKELVPHLFERFVRADKSRSREAGHSGLGLAIAASIAEAHGGNITVESRAGRTVFTITLPLTTVDNAGTAAELMSARK
jgi:two-component system sensor histidine kinase TrcS